MLSYNVLKGNNDISFTENQYNLLTFDENIDIPIPSTVEGVNRAIEEFVGRAKIASDILKATNQNYYTRLDRELIKNYIGRSWLPLIDWYYEKTETVGFDELSEDEKTLAVVIGGDSNNQSLANQFKALVNSINVANDPVTLDILTAIYLNSPFARKIVDSVVEHGSQIFRPVYSDDEKPTSEKYNFKGNLIAIGSVIGLVTVAYLVHKSRGEV